MATQISINSGANQFSELVSPQNNDNNSAIIDNEQAENVERYEATPKLNESATLFEQEKNSSESVNKEDEASKLDEAMESIAEFMHLSTQNVNFQKDDSTDKTIIKVFDSASNELIKQFPSEEVIEIAQKIAELRQDVGLKTGILLDEKV